MIRDALYDSLSLMYLRFKIIREAKGKLALIAGILVLVISIVAVSYTGQLIKIMSQATGTNAEAAKIFAISYLQSFTRGELGILVSTTLGLAILSVIIAPFTGTSATSLIPNHQLASVRASTRHRFTDSLITQFFSSIALLQLMTLTAVASLLTLDGGRIPGVLYAWASWPVLVMLSTLFVWVAEYLYRKFGEKRRIGFLAVTLLIIGAAVLFYPDEARTVFGIGTAYSAIIQGFTAFDTTTKILAVGILAILFVLLFFIAYKICLVALSQPETYAKQQKDSKTFRQRQPSALPIIELANVAFVQLWRNLEIRKPLIMATLFGGAIIFFANQALSIMSTIILIIPLIVCLSWGSNVFGALGTGFTWISSKPFMNRSIVPVFYAVQTFVIITLFTLMTIPSIIGNKIPTEDLSGVFLAIIATAFLMSRSAMDKSVKHPHPYKAGIRGEMLLPPAALIGYTMRFTLWSGVYGFLVSGIGVILIQIGLTVLAIIWSLWRIHRLNKKFQHSAEIRNKIIFTVAND